MTKTEYAKYLQSDHWREKRLESIELGDSRCNRCHIPRWLAELVYDQDLHVHHLTYENLGDEDFEDLEVLCRRCHELETFGRSELRKPKDATCQMCGDRHWNPRADLCAICTEVTSSGPLPFCFRVNHIDPSVSGPLWQRLLREIAFGIPGDGILAMLDYLMILEKESAESQARMAADTSEIPF